MSVFASSVKSFIGGLIGSPSEDKQDARTNEDEGYPSEVIISDPSDFDEFAEVRQAELELSEARIAIKHEAFRVRTYISNIKETQRLFPRHFDGETHLSAEEVLDIVDSLENTLMNLQDCLHDYISAELDVSIAEWCLDKEMDYLDNPSQYIDWRDE